MEPPAMAISSAPLVSLTAVYTLQGHSAAAVSLSAAWSKAAGLQELCGLLPAPALSERSVAMSLSVHELLTEFVS